VSLLLISNYFCASLLLLRIFGALLPPISNQAFLFLFSNIPKDKAFLYFLNEAKSHFFLIELDSESGKEGWIWYPHILRLKSIFFRIFK